MAAVRSRGSSFAEEEERFNNPVTVLDQEEEEEDGSDDEPTAFRFDDLKPGRRLSQTSISLEGYVLGIVTGSGIWLFLYFVLANPKPIWRTPLFLSILGFYHFCEFYTYARWNLKNTTKDSYLTFSNGAAYVGAMGFALVESVVTSIFFPRWQSRWAMPWIQAIGIALLVVGQFTRHSAIAAAGVSFNHHVQIKRRNDHVLVASGPYAWFRHPSYFGFYWWAVGSQLILGNAISTPMFAFILWRFFFRRIPVEEKYLIKMFGAEYERFRDSTPIGIPFMASSVDSALRKLNSRDAGNR